MLALLNTGRNITQATLYAGRHLLSRGKVRKFAVGGGNGMAAGRSKHPPLQNKGGAPAEEDRENPSAEETTSQEQCVRVRKAGRRAMKIQAKVTSKGRITVPREIRRRLGVRAGDKLEFEDNGDGMRLTAVRKESVFEKYRGIGNPGIGKGRKAIQKWLRKLRGHEDGE